MDEQVMENYVVPAMVCKIVLEPGDATRYEFVVVGEVDDLWTVVNVTHREAILVDDMAVRVLIAEFGSPPGYERYRAWADRAIYARPVAYVIESAPKSMELNPYTALAAIVAIWLFEQSKGKTDG